jgi:hypothetical protein
MSSFFSNLILLPVTNISVRILSSVPPFSSSSKIDNCVTFANVAWFKTISPFVDGAVVVSVKSTCIKKVEAGNETSPFIPLSPVAPLSP